MKTTAEIAQPLLNQLSVWQNGTKPLIIALDGYPGSGKTSVANFLENQSNTQVIHQDDYLLPIKQRVQRVNQHKDDPTNVLIFDFHDDQRLISDLRALKEAGSTAAILVEGVFLLHQKRYPEVWDKRVYISTDMEEADTRRIAREKLRWGDQYMPESDPLSLFAIVTRTYRGWAASEHPEHNADIVLKA